jgi:hypothetical protein
MSNKTPTANVPNQGPDEPRGDRGQGDRTWSPEQGEQGISNRVGDEDPTAAREGESFGQHTGEDVVSMAEEDPAEDEDDDFGDDDEEDEEDEDEEGDTDEPGS